ncbi:MAG: hypothetical protein Q8P20_03655 [bacterium]|nr:hypothetical protein [bacterium]
MITYNQQGVTKIRTFWGISILLIESVIVIFVFYFLYFFWIENPTPTSNILIVSALSKKSVTIPDSVDTNGWLIYSNSDYGFSIKYPGGYVIVDDEIFYGENQGKLINFKQANNIQFNLSIFGSIPEEKINEAYERITGISPDAYQFFPQKIDDQDAIVYRLMPGEKSGDKIYFIANGYFFEAPFNTITVNLLATMSL